MRDVAAEVAEAGVAEQRVEVRAVDVHLTAGVVHGLRDLEHVVLVHAVRRRVGDHQRGERVGMQRDLRPQIVEVDVAGLVARDDDDLHAREHRGCRVRAVRGRRDEAHRAIEIAVGAVIAADREEPGELALRAGVRLQRHGVVAGDLGEPHLELLDHREVAAHVGLGGERVHARELGPRHGRHLGRGVELHRARSERDHAAVQRVVAVGELLEVAHHRGLGAVRVEDRMREVLVAASQRGGHTGERHGIRERDVAHVVLVRARAGRTPTRRRRDRRPSSSRRPRSRPSRRRPRTADSPSSARARSRAATDPGVTTRIVSKNESETRCRS